MNQVDQIVSGVIKFLKTSGRMDLLPQIIQKLNQFSERAKGENLAIITSATALDKKQLAQLEQQLTSVFKRRLAIVNKVDPQTLGGFVVQVSDKIIDLSVNSYLSQIEENLKDEKN